MKVEEVHRHREYIHFSQFGGDVEADTRIATVIWSRYDNAGLAVLIEVVEDGFTCVSASSIEGALSFEAGLKSIGKVSFSDVEFCG